MTLAKQFLENFDRKIASTKVDGKISPNDIFKL